MKGHLVGRVVALALVICGVVAGQAHAMRTMCNVPIRTGDGIILRANVWLPDKEGRYPTILTVTGYNKDSTNPSGQACSGSAGIASADTSQTDRGYAVMLVDDRGTGASQGKWDSWGERTQLDYQDLLDFIQAQSWSDGSVGTTGASYMGITSFLVAEADAVRVREGKPRAVKAIYADVPMSDAYRDVTFHGGAVDSGFIPLWLGLTTGLSDLPPSTWSSDPADAATTYPDHLRNGFDFAASKVVDTTTGGDSAYDGDFYRLRSPGDRADELHVPAIITGGWWDIFQRGEPLLFDQLTHSPDKHLFMSAHYHASSGPPMEDPELKQKWFDHWLKGVNNGVEKTPPVNLYPINGSSWEHYSDWPVPGVDYTPLYLADNKALSFAKPAQGDGDKTPMLPASSPCSRMTTQWTAGAAAGPCETDNRTWEATSLTYTSPPLGKDLELNGPLMANVWAEMTSKDGVLVAVLSDVDPSGASNQVTAGFLLASQRAVDPKRSWYGPDHVMIRPWHPFTRESPQPVTPNDPQLYRIEVYPTDAIFKKGHSLRLTIGTADTPATDAPLPDLANQLGGDMRVLHGGQYDSHVLLPIPKQ